jgi:hypothetical protein
MIKLPLLLIIIAFPFIVQGSDCSTLAFSGNGSIDTCNTLQTFTTNLIAKCKTEKEKVEVISEFITNTISYGYGDASQKDSYQILFGKKKMAVCAGYSHVFKEMCDYANIKCKQVEGAVRTGFDDICFMNYSHAWNIVRVDSVWYGIDVTWMDPDDMEWFLVNPETMIHSHYSDTPSQRLTKKYVSPDSITKLPIVYPRSTDNLHLVDFYPKAPIVFVKDSFEFTAHKSREIGSIVKWPVEMLNVTYNGEPGASTTRYSGEFLDYHIEKAGDFNKIKVELNDSINLIGTGLSGVGDIRYLVVNGTPKTLMRHFISISSRKHKVRYANAIISAIKLRDKKAYQSLIGNDSKVAMSYENILKNEYISEIDNWNMISWGGFISSGNKVNGVEISSGINFTSVGHTLNFAVINGNLVPVSIDLSRWGGFEEEE